LHERSLCSIQAVVSCIPGFLIPEAIICICTNVPYVLYRLLFPVFLASSSPEAIICICTNVPYVLYCPEGRRPGTSAIELPRRQESEGLKNSILQDIVDTYRDYLGDALFSMVLFGSHARGDAKETSDYDLFIIAEKLPEKPLKRGLFIRAPLKGQFEEKFSIIAKTPREMAEHFPSLFLDLGLDGVILFDKDDFFKELQIKIRNIIEQAGLERKRWNGEFHWEWRTPPEKGWEITWSGYRAL